jgi:hypothetical protein
LGLLELQLMAHVLDMHFQRCASMPHYRWLNVYLLKLCIYKRCSRCHPKMHYMAQKIGQG